MAQGIINYVGNNDYLDKKYVPLVGNSTITGNLDLSGGGTQHTITGVTVTSDPSSVATLKALKEILVTTFQLTTPTGITFDGIDLSTVTSTDAVFFPCYIDSDTIAYRQYKFNEESLGSTSAESTNIYNYGIAITMPILVVSKITILGEVVYYINLQGEVRLDSPMFMCDIHGAVILPGRIYENRLYPYIMSEIVSKQDPILQMNLGTQYTPASSFSGDYLKFGSYTITDSVYTLHIYQPEAYSFRSMTDFNFITNQSAGVGKESEVTVHALVGEYGTVKPHTRVQVPADSWTGDAAPYTCTVQVGWNLWGKSASYNEKSHPHIFSQEDILVSLYLPKTAKDNIFVPKTAVTYSLPVITSENIDEYLLSYSCIHKAEITTKASTTASSKAIIENLVLTSYTDKPTMDLVLDVKVI